MLRTKQYSLIIFIQNIFNTNFFEIDFKETCLWLSRYHSSFEVSGFRLLLHGDCRIPVVRNSFLTFSYVNGALLIG